MSIMETTVSQFGAAFGGAAGPIRSVASRTADLVPTAARVAEMLNPNLDLRDRVGRLTIRLTYGIPAIAVELAREAGSQLLRGDYCALADSALCNATAIEAATDTALLACLGNSRDKLGVVCDAARAVKLRRQTQSTVPTPVLEPYVA